MILLQILIICLLFTIGWDPFFILKKKNNFVEGSEQVVAFIQSERFKKLTNKSLELNHEVPNEDEHTPLSSYYLGIVKKTEQ
jgi:hypothetical protein